MYEKTEYKKLFKIEGHILIVDNFSPFLDTDHEITEVNNNN